MGGGHGVKAIAVPKDGTHGRILHLHRKYRFVHATRRRPCAIRCCCGGSIGGDLVIVRGAAQIDIAFKQVVLHALDVVCAGVLVAVEAKGAFLSVGFILLVAFEQSA